jgi:hypothetical protein
MILIGDTPYRATPLPAAAAGAGVRLEKLAWGNESYDVVRDAAGRIACSCPHYRLRLAPHSCGPCKHGRAALAAGLVGPGLAPEVAPCAAPPPA